MPAGGYQSAEGHETGDYVSLYLFRGSTHALAIVNVDINVLIMLSILLS